jgi:hypothetical protein
MSTWRCDVCGSTRCPRTGSPPCIERYHRNQRERQSNTARRAAREALNAALAGLGSSCSYTDDVTPHASIGHSSRDRIPPRVTSHASIGHSSRDRNPPRDRYQDLDNTVFRATTHAVKEAVMGACSYTDDATSQAGRGHGSHGRIPPRDRYGGAPNFYFVNSPIDCSTNHTTKQGSQWGFGNNGNGAHKSNTRGDARNEYKDILSGKLAASEIGKNNDVKDICSPGYRTQGNTEKVTVGSVSKKDSLGFFKGLFGGKKEAQKANRGVVRDGTVGSRRTGFVPDVQGSMSSRRSNVPPAPSTSKYPSVQGSMSSRRSNVPPAPSTSEYPNVHQRSRVSRPPQPRSSVRAVDYSSTYDRRSTSDRRSRLPLPVPR